MVGATPGPWEAHQIDSTGALGVRQLGDTSSKWIAHTIRSGHKTLEEANANANLIAAAPALADALMAVLASNAEMNAPFSAANPLTRADRDAIETREQNALAAAECALRAAGRLP